MIVFEQLRLAGFALAQPEPSELPCFLHGPDCKSSGFPCSESEA